MFWGGLQDDRMRGCVSANMNCHHRVLVSLEDMILEKLAKLWTRHPDTSKSDCGDQWNWNLCVYVYLEIYGKIFEMYWNILHHELSLPKQRPPKNIWKNAPLGIHWIFSRIGWPTKFGKTDPIFSKKFHRESFRILSLPNRTWFA